MKTYQQHELTAEVLTKMFGDSCDWYSVLKNGKRVGTFSELRGKVLKAQAAAELKEKQKVAQSIQNKVDTKVSIKLAKEYFETEFKSAEVFINRTQPNIHINGCKCYIICGPTKKIRLGIMHHTKTFDEMIQEAGLEGTPNMSKNHVLFDRLTLEDAKDLIKLLCN